MYVDHKRTGPQFRPRERTFPPKADKPSHILNGNQAATNSILSFQPRTRAGCEHGCVDASEGAKGARRQSAVATTAQRGSQARVGGGRLRLTTIQSEDFRLWDMGDLTVDKCARSGDRRTTEF